MPQKNQTRPLQGRVGCEMLAGGSLLTHNLIEARIQFLAQRFHLTSTSARVIAGLYFVEAR